MGELLTWTSPDEKIHNQVDLILITRRWQSSIIDVWSLRVGDFGTDHYPKVAIEVKEQYKVEVWIMFATLANLVDNVDIGRILGKY
jgi:hypothetical protein